MILRAVLRRGTAAVAALAALVLLAVLAGCTPAPSDDIRVSPAGDVKLNLIEVDGIPRSYILHVPSEVRPGKPLPVVVMLHGAGGDAERARLASGFDDYADADGFIVVYPNGTQAAAVPGEYSWNAGACCGAPQRTGIDDVAFISAVLDEVAAQHPVDASRVYLTGFSNGGMLTYRLSCELGERFAGVAIVGGALNLTVCDAPSPMSVLIVHGTADHTVPYDGGESNERTAARFGQWKNVSVADSTAFWRDRDECDDEPATTIEGPIATDTYEGCIDDRMLEVVTISEGTHAWPRLDTQGYDASASILSFFQLS